LVANLAAFGLDKVPIVVQYNKRDLPNAVPLDQVDRFGEPDRRVLEARAKDGDGVIQTFFELVGAVWEHLDRDLHLAQKLKIDAQTFRASLGDHLGVSDATIAK
jgi:hypothetical protein